MNTTSRAVKWRLLFILMLVMGICLFLLWREKASGETGGTLVVVVRSILIAAALGAWFTSQSLIGTRPLKAGAIGDGIHELLTPVHRSLLSRPKLVSVILIVSSACIDLFGLFMIGASVFGPSIQPFVTLLILFALRQVCQAFCALPVPPDMIWKKPGIPSLFVTYDVSNDFFFSGHTAVAVLGAVEVARIFPWWLGVAAGVVAFLEGSVVLVLRAHYTMDVIAAVFAACFAIYLSDTIFSLL